MYTSMFGKTSIVLYRGVTLSTCTNVLTYVYMFSMFLNILHILRGVRKKLTQVKSVLFDLQEMM